MAKYRLIFCCGNNWAEFCEHTLNNDVVVQREAAKAGFAPDVINVEYDAEKIIMVMEHIDGTTLIDYMKDQESTMTEGVLDDVISRVSQLCKDLRKIANVRHPDFAARNIMIQSNTNKLILIDFEACPKIKKMNKKQIKNEYNFSMKFFLDDLGRCFSYNTTFQQMIFAKINDYE